MINQIRLLFIPRRLDADAVVSCADRFPDGALVFYGGSVCLISIGAAVGVCHGVTQQAGDVDLTGASIGHRIARVHFLCCFIERSEGAQVALLSGGLGNGGKHRVCFVDQILQDRSEFCKHFIHFLPINRGVIPAQTVAVGFTEGFQDRNQGIISAVPIDPCQAVKVLLIADPEGSAPGLPVCPSVHAVLLCVVLPDYKRGRWRFAVAIVPRRQAAQVAKRERLKFSTLKSWRLTNLNVPNRVPIT
jgi:hypothetical protein